MLKYFILLVLFYSEVGGDTGPILPLLPLPKGTLYGVPFKGHGLWTLLTPFTLTGNCKANMTYTIRKVSDLLDHTHELECIFAGGSAPERMPTGPLHATPITLMNMDMQLYVPVTQLFFWKGKYIEERDCNDTKTYIGINSWGQPLGATNFFMPSIRSLDLNLGLGEHIDTEPGIVMHYHDDVLQHCPELKEYILKNQGVGGVAMANSWTRSHPVTDFLRFVGRQEDGGDIYILKSYLTDWFREDKLSNTVAFSAVVNYDKAANPNAYPGISTKPLTKDFSFLFPGVMEALLKMLPFDNMISTPSQTYRDLRKHVDAIIPAMWSLMRDAPRSYLKMWKFNKNWLKNFDADKLNRENINSS